MSPVPCGLSPVDTILVLKFEWGQRGQAVLRFELKSGWQQTGKLELASTLTFGLLNPAGHEPNVSLYNLYIVLYNLHVVRRIYLCIIYV